MDYADRLEQSYYNTIATINGAHKIYLVQHRESGKIYIKKVLDIYNPNVYEYLLKHHITGIPKLFNIHEEDGQLILIEEYISGTSLQETINARTLTPDLIARFMVELCGILGELHSLNPPVIHRDIKPSNIIITPCRHVVLIDFNAAKHLSDTAAHDTMLLGTKGYAAPEQYGFGASTPQTDIYALGVLLRELSLSLPVPTSIFDAIIHKCTQINPSDRIKSVQALRGEIEQLFAPVSESAPAAWKKFILPGFRTRTPWKMMTSSVVYLFISWLCLSLEVKGATAPHLWIERTIAFSMMLSIVFCCFNYRNIWRFLPLCTNQHRLIRCLGVLILNFMIIVALLLAMLMLKSIF